MFKAFLVIVIMLAFFIFWFTSTVKKLSAGANANKNRRNPKSQQKSVFADLAQSFLEELQQVTGETQETSSVKVKKLRLNKVEQPVEEDVEKQTLQQFYELTEDQSTDQRVPRKAKEAKLAKVVNKLGTTNKFTKAKNFINGKDIKLLRKTIIMGEILRAPKCYDL